jgi:hypothetical protein
MINIPTNSPPSHEDLRVLMVAIGHELPRDYVVFVRSHNGAEPETNSIALVDNESGVRRFIPVSEAANLLSEIDGFPCNVVPLAEDDCGNYFYLDAQSGGIHFWDHEIEGQDELVADDLRAFLEKLSPFDASQVKLAPGQVKHVWIDPEFKKQFGG